MWYICGTCFYPRVSISTMFVICFEPCGVVKILNLVVSVIVMLYAVCHKALLKHFFKKHKKLGENQRFLLHKNMGKPKSARNTLFGAWRQLPISRSQKKIKIALLAPKRHIWQHCLQTVCRVQIFFVKMRKLLLKMHQPKMSFFYCIFGRFRVYFFRLVELNKN